MTASTIKKISGLLLPAVSAMLLSNCHTNLYNAAKYGKTDTIRYELENGENPDRGSHPAHMLWVLPTGAVTVSLDIAQVSLMIGTLGLYYLPWKESNTSPYLTKYLNDFYSTTPLEIAEEKRKYEAMCELYLNGAKASNLQVKRMTTEAAASGNAALLNRLVSKGITLNQNYPGEWSPLMQAIGNGHEECAKILIRSGDKLTTSYLINGEYLTCRDAAIRKNRMALYNKLLSYKPGTVSTSTNTGSKARVSPNKTSRPSTPVIAKPKSTNAWEKIPVRFD